MCVIPDVNVHVCLCTTHTAPAAVLPLQWSGKDEFNKQLRDVAYRAAFTDLYWPAHLSITPRALLMAVALEGASVML